MSVYFAYAPELRLVKIGFAENAWSRFSKIQSDSPATLVMAGIIDGTIEDEQALHARFSEHFQRGEWFRVEGGLAEYLDEIEPPIKPARSKNVGTGYVAEQLGISQSYASMLLTGHRPWPRRLAIGYYRLTGERVAPLLDATDEEIEVLERFERSAA